MLACDIDIVKLHHIWAYSNLRVCENPAIQFEYVHTFSLDIISMPVRPQFVLIGENSPVQWKSIAY
jgi:hypothetical protein